MRNSLKIFLFLITTFLAWGAQAIPVSLTFTGNNFIVDPGSSGNHFTTNLHWDTTHRMSDNGSGMHSIGFTDPDNLPGIRYDIFDASASELYNSAGGGSLGITVYDNIIDASTGLLVDQVEFRAGDIFDTYLLAFKGPSTLLNGLDLPDASELLNFTDGLVQHRYENVGTNTIVFEGIFDPRNGSRTAVPEPTSIALLGLGLAGLGFSRRKKAK